MSYFCACLRRFGLVGTALFAVLLAQGTAPAAARADSGDGEIWRLLQERAARGEPATRAEKDALVAEIARRDPRFAQWWARLSTPMKERLYSERLAMWRPIILCNFLGFDPKTEKGRDCETSTYRRIEESGRRWTPDGRYVGPSEDCIRANRRNRYGELICG